MAKSKAKRGPAGPDEHGVWTRQTIIDYAPDEESIPAAEKVLKKGGFGKVEPTADGRGWWVVCRGLTDTYQTSVRVDGGIFTGECTCPSRKYPCKHTIALLMYLLDHPEERAEPEAPKHAATDFEALIKAVFQNPDDDTPRLVFADYLEEQGQADRAALIRVQCELARTSRNSPREKVLKAEETRLVKAVRKANVDPLPEGTDARFVRGFLDLSTHILDYRDVGAMPARFTALFRDGWVEKVRVSDYAYLNRFDEELTTLYALAAELDLRKVLLTQDGVVSLAAAVPTMRAGRLLRVTVPRQNKDEFEGLLAAQQGDISAGTPGRSEENRTYNDLTPQTLDLLIRSGRIRMARAVFLDGELGDGDAERLAAADLTGVGHLILNRWRISPAGAASLATSPGLASLPSLGITETRLDRATVAALRNGPLLERLERLFLTGSHLTDDALAALAAGNGSVPRLRELHLGYNALTADGLRAFLASPNFPALEQVALGSNLFASRELLSLLLDARERPTLALVWHGLTLTREMGSSGVRIAAEAAPRFREDVFAGCTVTTRGNATALRLTRGPITEKGLRALAKVFAAGSLTELEFHDLPLKNEGAEVLAKAFKDFRPETLRLTHCRLQAGGFAALAASPFLDSVKTLDLTGNAIGKSGAAALVASEHLGSLERLVLTDNNWTTGAPERKILRSRFGNKLTV